MVYEDRLRLLNDEKYPLASKYDPEWVYENRMGCPCLHLAEALSEIMVLKPGMRILDMGCGKALTSIFFAKEFGVQVFAVDLWCNASENQKRIVEAGADDLVIPLHADVHSLPFAEQFFDAVVCINSFQFYGNSEFFLGEYIAPLMKAGAQFGIAFFGPENEFNGKVPDHMEAGWWPDFYYFHSLSWMKWHFESTRLFTMERGDDMGGDGKRLAEVWAEVMEKPLLDQFGIMRWNRMVCRRNQWSAEDFRV